MKNKEVIYENDRKAPRMRKGEFSTNVVSKELWRKFKTEFPEYKKISWEEFYQLWVDIAQTIREECVTNPLGVKLGSYTGELKLQYLPYKFEATDIIASNASGSLVNHLNLVSTGKVAKIKWERRWAVKFNKMLQFFAFQPNRDIDILAKDYMTKNPERVRMSRNTLGGRNIWRSRIK